MAIFAGKRQVAPERIPSVRLADTTVPSPIPGAIEEVGRIAGQVAGAELDVQRLEQAKQEKIDKALAKDKLLKDRTSATNAFVTYQNSLNGESNRLRENKGLTAEGNRLKFDTFSDGAFNKINETLTTDGARARFAADVTLHNINARQSEAVYENKEKFKGRESSYIVAGTASVQQGIRDFDNPNTHAISEDHIEESGWSLQELLSWDNPKTTLYISQKKSEMYEGIVRKWAIDDAEVARLSFETNKSKIDPTRHDELDALVSKKQTNQKAKEATDEIMLKHDTEKEQLEAAQKTIKDADVLDKTNKNIRTQNADKTRTEKQDKAAYRSDMFGKLHDLSRLPDVGLTQMLDLANSAEDGKDRSDFDKYARALIAAQDKTKLKVTDNVKFNEILGKISRGVYPDIATMRAEARAVLNDQDMNTADSFFESGGLLGGLKEDAIIKQYKLHSGGKSPFETDNAAQYQAMRQYIVDQVNALPPGRQKITPTELNKWGAEALIPVELPGQATFGGAFGEVKSTLAEAREQGFEFDVIVPDERKKPIAQALRDLGVTVNEINIRDYYADVEREVAQ